MISKKLTFILFFSIPFICFLFYLTPKFLLPSEYYLDNFIYIENLINHQFYHYDKFSTYNFDDSGNVLYNFLIAFICLTFKYDIYKSMLTVNAISLVLSLLVFTRLVNSMFVRVNLFLMLCLFLSTAIWASVLGSDVLLLGLLYLLVLSSFWNKKYTFLLIYSSVLIAINIYHLLFVLPLIASSFSDALELKFRLRKSFYWKRFTKTIVYLVIPLIIFYAYRFIYFGQFFPNKFVDNTSNNATKKIFLYANSITLSYEYLRFFMLPILVGVIFYFIKQRKKINIRYYAIFVGYVLLPFIYNLCIQQQETVGYENYYIIYLGVLALVFLFIRNFSSLSQKFFLGIFILFFALPQFKNLFISSLQSYDNNRYRIANEIKALQHGKIIAFYDNYISYKSSWNTIFANNRHTPNENKIEAIQDTINKMHIDLILGVASLNIDLKKYDEFLVPESTRQYINELKPDNSIELFYYYFRNQYNINSFKYNSVYISKSSNHYIALKEILIKNGAKGKNI